MTLTDPQIIDNLKEHFKEAILASETPSGELSITVEANRIHDIIQHLAKDPSLSFEMLSDLAGVHFPESELPFEVVYNLYSLKNNTRLFLKAPLTNGTPQIDSVFDIYKDANWLEREAYDMVGIRFSNHPDLRRILNPEGFGDFPLRKEFPLKGRKQINSPADLAPFFKEEKAEDKSLTKEGFIYDGGFVEEPSEGILTLNVGPSHPATHGTLRIILELDGEIVLKATPEIGFLHRGFEKLFEHRTYHQALPITDRLNYVSSPMNNIGWVLAVEKLLGIEVPERVKYIRVIISELSRISDHLVCIGTNGVDIGAFTAFLYMFEQREKIYDILEMFCGARLTTTTNRVGGLERDLPKGFLEAVQDFLDHFPPVIVEVEKLLTRNRIWYDRTRGVGPISANEAISYGFTGPCLRAAGVEFDIRKAIPYSGYEKFEFEIPVGSEGDTYDRYLVRMEEMRQSHRIIAQAIKNLPDGPYYADLPKVFLPPKKEVYSNIEAIIHHFKIIMDGFEPPVTEVYASTEAASGELGYYIISKGEACPYRVKIRPPCFHIYSAFNDLIKGRMISDVVAVLGSLNIVAGELDR